MEPNSYTNETNIKAGSKKSLSFKSLLTESTHTQMNYHRDDQYNNVNESYVNENTFKESTPSDLSKQMKEDDTISESSFNADEDSIPYLKKVLLNNIYEEASKEFITHLDENVVFNEINMDAVLRYFSGHKPIILNKKKDSMRVTDCPHSFRKHYAKVSKIII
jgi:hypothetical protein